MLESVKVTISTESPRRGLAQVPPAASATPARGGGAAPVEAPALGCQRPGPAPLRVERLLEELLAARRGIEAAIALLPGHGRGPPGEEASVACTESGGAGGEDAALPPAQRAQGHGPGGLSQWHTENSELSALEREPAAPAPPEEFVAPTLPTQWPSTLAVQNDLVAGVSWVPVTILRSSGSISGSDAGECMPEPRGNWVTNPNSSVNSVLALFSLLFLIHDLMLVTFTVAWQLPFEGYVRVSSFTSVSFWSADIGLTFLRGFYAKEELILARRSIAVHYLRTWLFPDLVLAASDWVSCIFLLDTSNSGEAGPSGARGLRLAVLGRFVRIAGLVRMMRLLRKLADVLDRHSSDVARRAISLVSGAVVVLFLTHVLACGWMAIGRFAYSDTGASWIDAHVELDGELRPFSEAPLAYQYVSAFHWACAQVTLTSIEFACANSCERCFTMCCVLVGFFAGSVLISFFSSKMVEYQTLQRERVQQLRRLRRYLAEGKVEGRLVALALQQATERLGTLKPLTPSDVPVLGMLSQGVRKELHASACRPRLLEHQLFRLFCTVEKGWLSSFCSEAVEVNFVSEADDLFSPGTAALAAYVLVSGEICYHQVPESSPVAKPSMRVVREQAWLCESALWSKWIHVGKAEATKPCRFLTLHVDAAIVSLKQHHAVRTISSAYCVEFHRRIMAARPPFADWPDDLGVPGTAFEELVVSMPFEVVRSISIQAVDHIFSEADGRESAFFGLSFAARWQMEAKHQKLKEEVQQGKCAVVLDAEGRAVRITSVVLIRVVDEEGHCFWQLGKMEGAKVLAKAEMPGGKRLRGESSMDAVERLFAGQLRALAGCVWERMEHNVTEETSREYGVHTKYLRTICHGTLESAPAAPCCTLGQSVSAGGSAPTPQRTSRNQSILKQTFSVASAEVESLQQAFLDRQVYVFRHAATGVARLYALLSAQEIEFFGTRLGEQVLRSWLMELQLPQESVQIFEKDLRSI